MDARGPANNLSLPATEGEEHRRFRLSPGVAVLVLGVLLIAVIVVGVLLSSGAGSSENIERVTIADLRADPDGWDNRSVILEGQAEDIRELPFLSQYALYTFRDETGSIFVLTRKGAPPDSNTESLELQAIYHSEVTLDDELKRIVEDQLGPLAGSIVGTLVPGIPLNVVFLEHERYEVLEPSVVRYQRSADSRQQHAAVMTH